MAKMALTLSLYLARVFSVWFGIAFSVLCGLAFIIEGLEFLRRSVGKEVSLGVVLEMIFLKLPTTLQELLPFIVLFAGIAAFARLNRTSELIIIRASGLSVWQFLMPIMVLCVLIGIFTVTVFNPLSSALLSKYEAIEGKYLKGQVSRLSVSESGLWLRQQDKEAQDYTIIHALRVAHDEVVLYDVSLYFFDHQSHFIKRIDAPKAHLQKGRWYIPNGFSATPSQPSEVIHKFYLPTTLSAAQLQESFSAPETISFWELPQFISMLKNAGFSALRHQLYWYHTMLMPWFLCAIVLITIPFSLTLPRQGKGGYRMIGALLVGLFIYTFPRYMGALGLSGKLSIEVAAFTPLIICTLLGVGLVLHFEEV